MPLLALSHSQLGFRPDSPKRFTLVPTAPEVAAKWPAEMPAFLHHAINRLRRIPPGGSASSQPARYFRPAFDISRGPLAPESAQPAGAILRRFVLRRVDSRWGPCWQGDLDDFTTEGVYQIECDQAASFPFQIWSRIHERIPHGYLNQLRAQRSACDIPGVRAAHHCDDGVLDTTGETIAAAGGWYDAGDHRKWMYLTLGNLPALAALLERGHPGFHAAARDEIAWGNRYFHAMVSPEGLVWEDIGGGAIKPGMENPEDWWFENHCGCQADNTHNRLTDNLPESGDERTIRTTYNPLVQHLFVRGQSLVAPHLPAIDSARCLALARRVWRHARARGHDNRTLFLASELHAALELHRHAPDLVSSFDLHDLAARLLDRQDPATSAAGLQGYFMEANSADAYRSIVYPCLPPLALLRFAELHPEHALAPRIRDSVTRFLDGWLLADASSNPYALAPYGVYLRPPGAEPEHFRDAGRGRSVRTFIHTLSEQEIIHGTLSATTQHAQLLARAARVLARPDWTAAAERLLAWAFGHNPHALSQFTGIGFRHPVPFSMWVGRIPDAALIGYIGRADDTPYVETSPLVEWNTQEIWEVPQQAATEASLWL